jgi:hypothetical protein
VQWGPDEVHESGYAGELAAFITTHSGGGPAVLWPEHDPPQGNSVQEADIGPRLADQLTTLLGRPVVQLPHRPPALTVAHVRADQGSFLLIQGSGSSDVRVTTPGEPGDAAGCGGKPLVVRLLQGEALYLPRGTLAVLRHEPGTRHLILQIAARPPAAGTD